MPPDNTRPIPLTVAWLQTEQYYADPPVTTTPACFNTEALTEGRRPDASGLRCAWRATGGGRRRPTPLGSSPLASLKEVVGHLAPMDTREHRGGAPNRYRSLSLPRRSLAAGCASTGASERRLAASPSVH